MTEGQSLYLLKLVPRILIQKYCLFVSYVLVRVNFYRNDAKRMVEWVTILLCYNYDFLIKEEICKKTTVRKTKLSYAALGPYSTEMKA